MTNLRKLAATALMRVENDGAYSNLVLNDVVKSANIEKAEAAFVSALFYGVIERKITLDFYIRKLSSQPLSKIPPLTRQVLRCGLYQIFYMDKIPASAAVNEAVKIIKKSKESRSAGYVNALLRNALRNPPKLPNDDSYHSLSVIYSCSESLLKALVDDYGIACTKEILNSAFKTAPVFIRINPLKTDVSQLTKKLCELGIVCNTTTVSNALLLQNSGSIENNPLYKNGYFHVQDLSSQMCADMLEAKPGDTVLDICSAPGGKAFTICENMNNTGNIIACDLYEQRVGLIASGAKRLGLDIIKPQVADASVFNENFLSKFDRILCDVPCSGSGIINRKPDIKYKNFDDNTQLNDIQLSILINAFQYLKPNGRLVYSTCSILKSENEGVVSNFLSQFPQARLIKKHTFLPHIDNTDGFFTAVIEKKR